MRIAILAVALGLLGTVAPPPAVAAKRCGVRCDQRLCREDCRSALQDVVAACRSDCPGYDEKRDGLENCLEAATSKDLLDTCINRCPAFPGECVITRGCVNDCRDLAAKRTTDCHDTFGPQLQRVLRRCDGFDVCRQTARADLHTCRQACSAAAATQPPSDRPPVVATAAATTDCDPACARKAKRCINGVMERCYADCDDECNGDGRALGICRLACRNSRCSDIRKKCASSDPGHTHDDAQYNVCCNDPTAVLSAASCEPTTTSTSVTTSSSTATSTSTTRTTLGP